MTEAHIREQVLSALSALAPEVDVSAIRSELPLRDQVDLDSFDWLQLLLRLDQVFGVDIPSADYGMLTTVDAFVRYLAARVG